MLNRNNAMDARLAARRRAEKLLGHAGDADEIAAARNVDSRQVIHELRVHQVELQAQNEELRASQAELDRSREQYRELYESVPVASLTLAADDTILQVNPAALAFFGMAQRNLLGTRLSKFLVPTDAARFEHHRRDVLGSALRQRCALTLVVDGQPREVQLESVSSACSQAQWRTALVDVTELHQLESSLHDHAFLAEVLDGAGLLVVLDPSGRIVRANRLCKERLCGPRSVVGRPFSDVFALPSERAPAAAQLQALLQRHDRGEWETRCRDVEGRERVLSWSLTPLPGSQTGAETQYVILSGTDLTERRQLEAKLVVADRLAAVGTLAAGVAHEINNPLAYAMISLELASKLVERKPEPAASSAEALSDLLRTAREGNARIRCIVDDLRSLGRCDETKIEVVDLRSVLESCVRLSTGQITARARLIVDYADELWVRGNRTRLGQVFLNLLVNAAQAIAEGNPAANSVSIRTRAENERLAIVEIGDTGVGIEPAHLPRLFDPFFTTKANGEGMGLGLSICHSIITSLGGTISVQSAPGQGSCFRVTLPQAYAGDVTAPLSPPRTPPA
jgi:PAS domain S-box-containing protein